MNASLVAGTAVVLGVIVLEQGNLAWRASTSPAAEEAARRAAEAGGLLAILSAPWVLISLFIS